MSYVIFTLFFAALSLVTVGCNRNRSTPPATPTLTTTPTAAPSPTASPSPTGTPRRTPFPIVTLPPVPPSASLFFDLSFRDFKVKSIPVDLTEGEVVAVSADVPTAGQLMAVAVKDPSGEDLLTWRSAEGREVRFQAVVDGRYVILVAPMDSRGDPVAVIVRIYPATP